MKHLSLLLLLFTTLCSYAQSQKVNGIGTLYPSETFTYTDPISNVNIRVLTDTLSNDSYIYQTDPMWSADGRFILFRSSVRAGEPRQGQFFLMEAASGRILQITEGKHGAVYMANRTNHFFINRTEETKRKGKTLSSWNLYKVSIDALWDDALKGKVRKASQYETLLASVPLPDSIFGRPGGWCVSCDDTQAYIVIERKGTAAEEEEMNRIAFRPEGNQPIKIKPSLGGIRKIDLTTGKWDVVVNTLFKVGHIQSSRFLADEILFCNETGGDAHQRMWYVKADGTDFRPIYKETPLDWVTHETFQTRDHVYFNILGFQDRLRKQASGIMRINLRTNDVECLGQVELEGCPFNPDPMLGGRGFWHCNSTRDGSLATGDTFAGNVYIIDTKTGARTLIATDCRMKPDHAQPHFSPDGRYLLFQSGHFTDGKRLNLMMVDLQSLHRPTLNIQNLGAKADGKTLDSPIINRAIDQLAQQGGGTILFPQGNYLCHSIRLKSNITLHLSEGATIIAAPATQEAGYDAPEDNPYNSFQDFGHSHWQNSLIWGIGLDNVAIIGKGRIDGSNMTRGLGRAHINEANKAIALRECSNVRLADFEMLRCGHFALLATGVNHMTIDRLRIDTNRDGLDIDCCQDVKITNCQVNTPWDDAIVLKSSYALGRFLDCERITVDGCQVSGYDCGTLLDGTRQLIGETAPDRGGRTGRIKLGTESSGGYRDITIRNCQFEWCRGIALETVDGGTLQNVTIENITMNHIVNSAIFLRLGSRLRSPEGTPVGTLSNVIIRNLRAYDVDSRYSSIIAGIPGNYIHDILIEDCDIHYRGGIRSTQETTTIAQADWEKKGHKEPQKPSNTTKSANRSTPSSSSAPSTPQTRRPPLVERDTALVINLSQPIPEVEGNYPEPWMFGVVPAKGFYFRHAKNITLRNVHLTWQNPDVRDTYIKEDCEGIKIE